MNDESLAKIYCGVIFSAGCVCVALLAGSAHFIFIAQHPVTFAILTAGVVLGEMLPIKVPHRGNNEELTLSAAFAMALLLMGGLGPAVVAQCAASALQDVHAGKPAWRVRFNMGQYTLSMAAAWMVIALIAPHSLDGVHHPTLLAMMPAAAVFFIVNTGLVGIAVATYQGAPIGRYFLNNLSFVVFTGGLMLVVAPIVLAAADYSKWLVPLCLAPVVGMYNSISRGVRSDHAARHDSLTELPNRAAFQEAVTRAVGDERVPATVLLIDLDRFKEVNDTLGHRYGDLLLVQVARRFRVEVGGSGEIARLGGDEFAIVCPDSGPEAAVALAERLARCLREPFHLDQMVVDAQASIGIALFPEHAPGVESLLQKADVAMYRAKETGSPFAIYDERHDHHSPARLALTAELRTAVQTDAISLWYQPELDLEAGRVLAVEALARWEHPTLGLLNPDSFIRLAERTGTIRPLTDRVIEIALRQVSQWQAGGLDLVVAVNLSPQVLADQAFTEKVMAALEREGVAPSRLKLEVTESALMSDPTSARAVLEDLHRLGVAISIDDFGTGYSSLAYLAELPVSEVKIDRSFVSRMRDSSSDRIIVTSTIDLAHHLGMKAVAEGVERRSLLADLRTLGCDAAQGYGISEPLPGEELTKWLAGVDGSGEVPAEGVGLWDAADAAVSLRPSAVGIGRAA